MITLSIFYAIVLAVFIITLNSEEPYSQTLFIIWSAVYGAFLIWFVLWFAVIKKRNEEKAEIYKKELERITRESLSKIGNAYKLYGADYMEKVRKEQEERAKRALKSKDEAENTQISAEN